MGRNLAIINAPNIALGAFSVIKMPEQLFYGSTLYEFPFYVGIMKSSDFV